MAQDNNWWTEGATAVDAKKPDGQWWTQGATPTQSQTRSIGAAINDTVIEVANAAAGGVSSAANFVKPGNDVSQWIDKNIVKAGEEKQSDAVKAEKQRLSSDMNAAEGIGDEVSAVGRFIVNNPVLSAAQAAGSFVGPGLAVKGATTGARAVGAGAKAVERAGRAGGVAAGAAMAGGDAAGTAYALATKAGATEEQAVAAGRQASVLPALVGGAGGAFGAEKLLAGAKGFTGGTVARALKTGASEAVQEGLEEGITQYEGQRAAMPYDATIDPSKGVAGAAAMGVALGGITGAGMGALDGMRHGAQQQGADALSQAVAEAAAADAQAKADAAASPWTTAPGAADTAAPAETAAAVDANSPRVAQADFETQPGAAPTRENTLEFTRDFDTGRLALADDKVPALGFSPLAGTPTVFPDGSVALNGEQEFQHRTGADPARAHVAQAAAAGGSLSSAALTAMDSGATGALQQQAADTQAQQAQAQEQAAAEKATSAQEQADEKAARAGQTRLNMATGDLMEPASVSNLTDQQLSETYRAARKPETRRILEKEIAKRAGTPEETAPAADAQVPAPAPAPRLSAIEHAGIASTLAGQELAEQPLSSEMAGLQAQLAQVKQRAAENGSWNVPLMGQRRRIEAAMAKLQAAETSTTTEGVPDGSQAAQAQQDSAQPPKGPAAPAVARRAPASEGRPSAGGAVPAAGVAAAAPGAQAAAEFTTVQTAAGRTYTVRTADLSGSSEKLSTFTAQGKPSAVRVPRAAIMQASGPSGAQRTPALDTSAQAATKNVANVTEKEAEAPAASQAAEPGTDKSAAPARKPRGILAKKAANEEAARADYFTPGNIVTSYGGHDRVTAYSPPDADGRWSVTVQAVEKQGDAWRDKAGEQERVHGTQPDARDLKSGPVARAAQQAAPAPAPAPAPADASAQADRITDFGEKIGGARKDQAASKGAKVARPRSTDDRPAWARRFEISQIAKSSRPGEEGRWTVRDARSLDAFKQPRQVGRDTYASREEAEQAVPLLAVAQKHRVVPTRGDGVGYEIWRDVNDRKRVKVVDQVFATREAALEYMANNAQTIIETNTTFGEADLPRPPSEVRTGGARRTGDARDSDFMEVFGFRGVEFGNWNNQQERQQLLNDAYDGLLDLAEVMDVPPRAISLDGDLALAFGARGHGLSSARAHYEPGKAVINLTKMNGAGSLAHEWFHALDHYFGRQDGKAPAKWVVGKDGTRSLEIHDAAESNMASGGTRGERSGMRPELREAFADVMRTIARKGEAYVEDTARADKFVAFAREDVSRRIKDIRADLARDLDPKYYKRHNKAASAEQLAEFDSVAEKIVAGELLELRLESNESARSIASGIRWTNDALNRLSAVMKAVRGRQGFTADKDGPLDRLRGLMQNYSARLKMLADAQGSTEKTRAVPTEFVMNAKELDQGWGQDYWTRPHELAARAFQGYVEDKIAERGGRSPFLNYGPEAAVIATPWGFKRPFPAGTERAAINKSLDKLVEVIQTREGDAGGVALFRRESADSEAQAPGFDVDAFLQVMKQPAAYSEAAQRQAVLSVSATVDAIRATWGPNAPEVVVAFDMQDPRVPEAARAADLRQRSGGARGAPEGFYYRGKAYLMASRLNTPADASRVLFHEVLGHHGLRGKFGRELDQVLNQVATMRKAEVAAKMQEYGLRGVNSLSVREAAEEVLAEMAEKNPRLHFVQRAIAAIRNFLRANVPGFRNMRLTDNDIIQAYILPAREFVTRKGDTQEPTIARAPVPSFSRTESTQATYESRIDALFAGGKAQAGTRILDSSDVMGLLGYPKVPLMLNESHLRDGLTNHPEMTAVAWKKVPGWIENPAAVYSDPRHPTRLTLIAPEPLAGYPVVMVIESRPNPAGSKPLPVEPTESLLVTVYAKTAGGLPAPGYLASSGHLKYVDTKNAPEIWQRGGGQFPKQAALSQGRQKILTEKQLGGYKRAQEQKSAPESQPRAGGQFPRQAADSQVREEILAGKQPVGTREEAGNSPDGAGELPVFSRSKLQDIKASALEQLHQTLRHEGKVSLWDKTVGTMRHLGERSPTFKPVYEAAQRFIDDVSMLGNDAADMAPRLLPRVETLADLKKKPITAADNKAVARPVFEGTLMWARDVDGTPIQVDDLAKKYANVPAAEKAQILLRAGRIDPEVLRMWQGLPLAQYEAAVSSRFESKALKPGVVWTADELAQMFGLNAEQVSLYQEARSAIDRSIDMTARADMLRVLGADYAGMRDLVLQQENLSDAMKVLTDTLQADARENPDRAERLLGLNNAVVKSYERAKDLQDFGYAPLSRFGRYTVDVVDAAGERQYFGMFETMREANQMRMRMASTFPGATVTSGTMSQEAFKLFQGITPESLEQFGSMLGLSNTGDEAKDKAFQAYLQLAKNNHSALKRLIHRKGIAGYSEDVGRVLASFVYSNARLGAGGLNAGTLETAIEGIPKEQGELRDVAMGLRSYIQDPQEEGQAVRGMLFAQYLGGSVASALVNMTQPFQITMPWLSQYGGMRRAGAQLAAAVRDMARGGRYETDLAQALQAAEDDGVVSPQEIHQLMAQARGTGSLRTGDGTRAGDARAAVANNWERVKVAWGQPFGLAEQFNRRSTFIAAYRLAKEQGLDAPGEFARRAVVETQFVYSKANKPKWARGSIGGTLFAFKTYSVSYLELMQRMWTQGGPEGKRAVGWALAMLMLMGGAGGLPFVEDLEDLIDGVGQLMGYNVSSKQWRKQVMREYIGKELGEFVEQGVSGLPGAPIDISGRLGMGNLLPGTGLLLTKQSRERDLLEVAGPAGDLIARGFTGARKALTGDIGGAALEVSPAAVRNAFKGADMATSGIYNDSKGYKVIDTTLDEAIAKAIGFQPHSVAQVQESNSFMQRSKAFYTQTSSDIKAQWAKALFEKDDAALERVRERLADWNRDNPEQPIVVKMPDVWKKVREMGKDRTQRIAETAPKALRGQMRDMARENG